LPFLRFTRDKRGYETTSLVHAVRRSGRSRHRILYWFRTPPGVKVGRPALDEEAIRWIEEHNPDIEFNWPKILEAKPPAEAPADDARIRRGRREKVERRRRPRPPAEPEAEPALPLPVEAAPEAALVVEIEADLDEEAAADSLPEEELVEAFEQLTHPEAEERIEPAPMPVEQSIGPEQLTRLRARFAELQARITERGGDADRVEALRAQAEPLNPDAWVTQDEVRQGVEGFEARIRDLRAALGLRRRRRSRRGGRRHRGGEGAPPAQTPPGSSE
jgi:hypothetical protein